MTRHVIFDFFGTLVGYRHGVEAGTSIRARGVLERHGVVIEPATFTATFGACFDALEADAERTLDEYSMDDAARLLMRELDLTLDAPERREFIDAYLADWNEAVAAWPRLDAFLSSLSAPKSVITNTHDEGLVPDLLATLGVAEAFERVTTSVGHGRRKPDASIYRAHLEALGLSTADAVFVGDNPACDYFGPRAVGIEAYLIAPQPIAGVAESHRLTHLYELPTRL